MKHILLLLLLTASAPAFAQFTSDSVTGTWIYVDNQGLEQKLVITKDSVTVFAQYLSGTDSNELLTIAYGGRYTIEQGNKIHVIFNDKPREEAFYKIVRAEDGTLRIEVKAAGKKKDPPQVYKRQ